MQHRHSSSDYSVVVDGAFVAPGLRFVQAAIRYVPEGADPDGHAGAQLELLRGIVAVSRRGWRLGARNVRVVGDGGREVAGFFEVVPADAVA